MEIFVQIPTPLFYFPFRPTNRLRVTDRDEVYLRGFQILTPGDHLRYDLPRNPVSACIRSRLTSEITGGEFDSELSPDPMHEIPCRCVTDLEYPIV